jgi:Flp pilus assembly protein TadD
MTDQALADHSNQGYGHQQQGRLDEAVACYRMALNLKPDCPEAHNNLGTALAQQGLLEKAVQCFRKALGFKPDYPDAYTNLGTALQQQGLLQEAIACFRIALDLQPESPEAHNSLGCVLGKLGRSTEAVACYRRAIDLKPDYAEAHYNLGNVLRQQQRLDEAVVCFRRAIDLKPNYTIAVNNMGTTLQQQERLDDAVVCYLRAIDLRPDLPEAHNNLGGALRQQGRLDDAVVSFRRAIDLQPDYPDAHTNLALALLARGDMAEGWQEYEWRWTTPQGIKAHRNFAQPQWRGEAAKGRTLLIHAEQGFGDTLQFCRYAPLAAACGLRVIVEVPRPLVRLLRSLSGVAMVVGAGEELPPFDLHCPMLSMPLALGTTMATIPGAASYLHADKAQVAAWRMRLAAMANHGPRIGLVWAGAPDSTPDLAMDRRRSLSPGRLAVLSELAGLHFFSLQKVGSSMPEAFRLTDFMEGMGDFADTAALIANLDLVISVDTAVAHLAAALGKPVWVLDRFDPCWRWLVGRYDSPWYPALRLYRQPHPGDWGSVIAEVSRDLRSLAGTTTPSWVGGDRTSSACVEFSCSLPVSRRRVGRPPIV